LVTIKGIKWAKLTITFSTNGSGADTGLNNIFYNSSSASFSYTGDGSSSLAWWGPCIKQGATC
jgi:hypothetical protein